MNELDQLLQDALDDAASRVPVSKDAWIRNEELLHAHRPHRARAALLLSTVAAGVVAILVAVTVWLIPGQHGATPATGDSLTPAPAPTTTATPRPTPHPSAASSATETTPSAPTSGTASSPVSTGPINEPADDAVRSELLQAFTAYRSQPDHPTAMATIPPTAVEGLASHQLYYAYEPSTDTYWAKATFEATPQAKKDSDFIGFQDGGSTAVFSRTGEGTWTVRYVGRCDLALPSDVIQLWSLPSHVDDPLCR